MFSETFIHVLCPCIRRLPQEIEARSAQARYSSVLAARLLAALFVDCCVCLAACWLFACRLNVGGWNVA